MACAVAIACQVDPHGNDVNLCHIVHNRPYPLHMGELPLGLLLAGLFR